MWENQRRYKIQTMAAPFAVVVDVLDFFRRPGGKFEIVGDDARAFLQLLFQNRSDFIV